MRAEAALSLRFLAHVLMIEKAAVFLHAAHNNACEVAVLMHAPRTDAHNHHVSTHRKRKYSSHPHPSYKRTLSQGAALCP
jgi:hypothetical protein